MLSQPYLAEYLGTEAHLAARLQFYHAGVELHIAFLNIRGKDMLIVLDGCKSDTVCHCWDDAVSDKLFHPTGIAEVLCAL